MASTISAGTTTTTALSYSADTSGVLQLQTNGTTTAVTIDTSQNVGIGTSSPANKLDIQSTTGVVGRLNNTGNANDTYWEAKNTFGDVYFGLGGTGAYMYTASSMPLQFYTAGSERMRIDSSGNFLVGVTTAGSSGLSGFSFNSPTGSSNVWIGHTTGTASGTAYVGFNYNGSGIGSITQNGTTGVLYNLTSDYRLKNDQQPLTGAKEFVMALQPKKWQWWDGSGEGVGFVAHEFMEVAKYSGHGEKDAVDADGKPVYQSIQPSSSEVMANLVSFIQELSAQVTTLQTQVTALKG